MLPQKQAGQRHAGAAKGVSDFIRVKAWGKCEGTAKWTVKMDEFRLPVLKWSSPYYAGDGTVSWTDARKHLENQDYSLQQAVGNLAGEAGR